MKKGLMMITMGLALLAVAAVQSRAEQDTAAVASSAIQVDGVGAVDLAKFFSNVRTGYLFGTEHLASAYIPLATLHGRSGVEYINLDSGVGYDSETRRGKPIVILGGRVDSFMRKAGSLSPRVTTAIFPALEVGPTLMIDFSQSKPLKHLKFMFSIAYKLGGE